MKIKKLFAGILAAVMALSLMTVPAFAEGETTTGTITVENATYGKEYKAYKIFDATYSGTDAVSYTVSSDLKDQVSTELFDVSTAADKNGNYSVSKKTTATDAQIIDWVKSNYSTFDSTGKTGVFEANNATVKFTEMPFGYYYVTSTLGTAIAIDTAKPDATVKDKNASAPTDPVKTIVSVDGTAQSELTSANAHVGSVVGFKVTGNATNWTTSGEGTSVTTTQNTVYEFEDTPTNMNIDETSVKVKMNGTEIASDAFTATLADGKLSVSIPLVKDGVVIYPANAENSPYIPVEVTYTATIIAAAAGAPAKNEIGDSKVEINTYAFQVAKTDGSAPLPGAQFELWANGAALTFIDNSDGTYTYSPDGTVITLDMTTNTTITVKGLDNTWTYTLKETKVPDGYNQAEDKPIAGSSLTKVEDGTDTSPTSITLYKETVVNQKGAVLPSTGGMGTTMFYVIGAILMAGAGVVLVSKRRMAR